MPFEKGQSGNPGGRLKIPQEVRELARGYTEKCILKAAEFVDHQDANVSLKAIVFLTERAWGKPAQPVDGDGEGGAIKQLVEIRFVRPGDAS
jgi:hypothetical protein